MKNYQKFIYLLIALFASVMAWGNEHLMIQEILGIGMFTYYLLNFIDSIGKSYNPLDIPILLALFQCMVMPTVVYRVYNDQALVVALKYDMGVTAETYFSFMFPAILLFILGIKLPQITIANYQQKFFVAVNNAKHYLTGKGNMGILLMAIGVVIGFMQVFIPGELRYVAYLFSKLLYVGILYVYFSDLKNRNLFLISGIVFILLQALAMAMFGELVFTLALGIMLVFLGKKVSSFLKFGITIIGFVFLILVQSIKGDYRAIAWSGQTEQGNSGAFFSLLLDRIQNPQQFFDWGLMFPTVVRANQGMIIGKVMMHVPANEPFAEGETIFTTLAASFVPRLLWPDKPKSGGHENMLRFTGFKIEGYSMNISPMGEAYGNFGVNGGIVFMFFYGLFFSLVIVLLFNIIRKRPTLILWFPTIFLNSIQMETDILMCVNSLIKNLLFVWFCYWAADRFLRLKL
ncbi:MAG: hypothetical protein KA160_09045 [Lacibacter sp.]|nr:hypothetical protein [Lacibacter sp.]